MADKKISELTALTGADTANDDQLVIVDTSAGLTKNITMSEFKNALDTATGFVRITGDTMTGNLSMGDNVKAIFGAGSDLQIYHSGAGSYIDDTGTGNLFIRANDFRLGKYTGEFYLKANSDGNVELYYDNALKLATTSTGIDVTGTLVSDGLTVDGDLAVSSANSRIRLFETDTTDLNTQLQNQAGDFNIARLDDDAGGSTVQLNIDHATGNVSIPNGNLDVTGTVTADGLTGDSLLPLSITAASGRAMNFYANGGTLAAKIASTGDISFYDSAGSSQSFYWDASAESLGIGTSSPTAYGNNQATLVIEDDTNPALAISDTGQARDWYIVGFGDGLGIRYADGGGSGSASNITESAFFKNNGNVGIGTSSPDNNLEIFTNSADEGITIKSTGNTSNAVIFDAVRNANSAISAVRGQWDGTAVADMLFYAGADYTNKDDGYIVFRTSSADNIAERMRIDSSGVVVINQPAGTSDSGTVRITGGTSGLSNLQFADTADGNIGMLQYNHTSNYLLFQVNNAEAMRIDSSGRVGIGGVPNTNWRNDIADQEVLMLGTEATLYSDSGLTTALINNALINNADTFVNISTRGASQYFQYEGAHKWYTAASASAGSNINTEMTSPKMTLDVSGNLLVGMTSANTNNDGAGIRADGLIHAKRANVVATFNRKTSDGAIVELAKDNTVVGSIGTFGGRVYLADDNQGGISFSSASKTLFSTNNVGSVEDNQMDIGSSSYRFKDLYLSGGVYLGGTGAANKLDDYEEGTWTPTFETGTATTIGQATYTKIGRSVTLCVENLKPSDTTSSNVLKVQSLPFAPANGAGGSMGSIMAQYRDNDIGIACYIPNNVSEIRMYYSSYTGSFSALTHASMFNNSAAAMYFTITYFTT